VCGFEPKGDPGSGWSSFVGEWVEVEGRGIAFEVVVMLTKKLAFRVEV
jgi:hypothetical protein